MTPHLSLSYHVGPRLVEWSYAPDVGIICVWDPAFPERGELQPDEVEAYFRGRNEFFRELASEGIRVLLITP